MYTLRWPTISIILKVLEHKRFCMLPPDKLNLFLTSIVLKSYLHYINMLFPRHRTISSNSIQSSTKRNGDIVVQEFTGGFGKLNRLSPVVNRRVPVEILFSDEILRTVYIII